MMEFHQVGFFSKTPSPSQGSFPFRFRQFFIWVLFLIVCILPAMAGAGEGVEDLPGGGMGTATIKMFGSLILVLGIIAGLYYLARHLRLGRFALNRSTAMRIIGTLSLAPKRSVALVEICGKWLVLGVGTETVTLLCKLEEPPEFESSGTTEAANFSGFQTLLRQKILRRTSQRGAMGGSNEQSD